MRTTGPPCPHLDPSPDYKRGTGMTTTQAAFRTITQNGAGLSFDMDGESQSFRSVSLPDEFMDWVIEGRRAMYDVIEGVGTAPFFQAHLPVVVTRTRSKPIPFNTSNKGVGLLPQEDKIEEYCELLERTLESTRDRPPGETMPERLNAVRRLLERDEVSDRALITLEIFEKQTFRNLCDFPVASLHYTDQGPTYLSYQIDVVVEILTPGHPAYRFAFLSRQLFEQDRFHITQTTFPYAYLFHPVHIKDKTPRRRRH